MAIHFTLTAALQEYAGYLEPRHTLVVVALLLPFAAIFAAHLVNELSQRGRRGLARIVMAACLLPLAIYSLRTPNKADAHIAEVARELRTVDPDISSKLLVGGSSQRRLAFYAGMRMQPWPENESTHERRLAELRRHILGTRPDYFAIDTGSGDEWAGNDELLEALRADPAIGGRCVELRALRAEKYTLHIWQFDWNG